MTDRLTTVSTALGGLSPRHLLSRGGHPLLALPKGGEAARRALDLYQPQRGIARKVASLLRGGSPAGLHRILLPKKSATCGLTGNSPDLLPAGTDPESIGILFGNAEHRVFRAVLSYRVGDCWEVGKLAVGSLGVSMLDREAAVMADIGAVVPEVPRLLGLERSEDARLLRMPYSRGSCLGIGDVDPVRNLLQSWTSGESPRALQTFPEWQAMSIGLARHSGHDAVLERLSGIILRPSIRHGDFARWNLLRTNDGEMKVLDWEWGERRGMPGLDLVHYLAQDFRLVRRLPPARVITETVGVLESPYWRTLLESVGWVGHEKDLVIACLAFKQGAEHQDNGEILKAAMATSH
jgi:hypothetical protein